MEELEKAIIQCPKTMKDLHNFYVEQNEKLKEIFNDNLLRLSITRSPYSTFKYFDKHNLIFTPLWQDGEFVGFLNGNILETDDGTLTGETREEVVTLGVIYLMREREKTL